jgi:hypothetical protein
VAVIFIRVAIILLALLALPAFGDVTIQPLAPVAGDFIVAKIDIPGPCGTEWETFVTGTMIRMNVNIHDCIPGSSIIVTEPIGVLPAGTYTYEFYLSDTGGPFMRLWQQTIVVGAAPPAVVPVASPMLLFLVSVLAGMAVLTLRRS